MESGQIEADIARKIEADIARKIRSAVISGGLDYLFFIKRHDRDSECLTAFVKDNYMQGRFINTGTVDGFMVAEELGILDYNVPCIYSTKRQYIVYQGCPESIEDLEV